MDSDLITKRVGDEGPSLIAALLRYWPAVVGTAVLAAVAGFGLSQLQTTLYEAQTELILTNPRDTGVLSEGSQSINARYVRNEASLIDSEVVAAPAAELLGMGVSTQYVLETVTADASQDLDLVTVRATDPDPDQAAAIANAVAEAYGNLKLESVRKNADRATEALRETVDRLRTDVATLDATLADDPDNSALRAERDAAVAQLVSANSRVADIQTSAALFGSGVEVLELATAPESPVQPQPLRNGVVAAVLGLLVGGSYAWWRSQRTPMVTDRHEPAAIIGAPLLGDVPVYSAVGASGPIPTISSPHTAAAEAYQYVFTALSLAAEEAGATMVVLSSANPGDGKTVTTVNLAVAALQDGRRVLAVDADERARGLSQLAGDDDLMGLTDLANDTIEFEDCVHPWTPDSLELRIVPAGSPLANTAGFFRSVGFRKAMTTIRGETDLALIDSPPVLSVAETANILAQADALVLIVNEGTPVRDLNDVRMRVSQAAKPILGYLYNRSQTRASRYGYPQS